jgi:hypothetical protein
VAGSCEHGNVPYKAGNLLASRVTASFSRRTLLHGVGYLDVHTYKPDGTGYSTT